MKPPSPGDVIVEDCRYIIVELLPDHRDGYWYARYITRGPTRAPLGNWYEGKRGAFRKSWQTDEPTEEEMVAFAFFTLTGELPS